MKWAILACFLLAGCVADQEQAMGQCKLEALNKYPGNTWEFGGGRQAHVSLCMEAKGYKSDIWSKSCPDGLRISDGALFEGCYRPMGAVSAATTAVERWLKRLI